MELTVVPVGHSVSVYICVKHIMCTGQQDITERLEKQRFYLRDCTSTAQPNAPRDKLIYCFILSSGFISMTLQDSFRFIPFIARHPARSSIELHTWKLRIYCGILPSDDWHARRAHMALRSGLRLHHMDCFCDFSIWFSFRIVDLFS